jgi:hypothetical protein
VDATTTKVRPRARFLHGAHVSAAAGPPPPPPKPRIGRSVEVTRVAVPSAANAATNAISDLADMSLRDRLSGVIGSFGYWSRAWPSRSQFGEIFSFTFRGLRSSDVHL